MNELKDYLRAPEVWLPRNVTISVASPVSALVSSSWQNYWLDVVNGSKEKSIFSLKLWIWSVNKYFLTWPDQEFSSNAEGTFGGGRPWRNRAGDNDDWHHPGEGEEEADGSFFLSEHVAHLCLLWVSLHHIWCYKKEILDVVYSNSCIIFTFRGPYGVHWIMTSNFSSNTRSFIYERPCVYK